MATLKQLLQAYLNPSGDAIDAEQHQLKMEANKKALDASPGALRFTPSPLNNPYKLKLGSLDDDPDKYEGLIAASSLQRPFVETEFTSITPATLRHEEEHINQQAAKQASPRLRDDAGWIDQNYKYSNASKWAKLMGDDYWSYRMQPEEQAGWQAGSQYDTTQPQGGFRLKQLLEMARAFAKARGIQDVEGYVKETYKNMQPEEKIQAMLRRRSLTTSKK